MRPIETVKRITVLAFGAGLLSIPLAFADNPSYQSLLAKFQSASPATQRDLTGAFVGDCYLSPQIAVAADVQTYTQATLLIGHQFKDGFHVGLMMLKSLFSVPEPSPGSQEQEYVQDWQQYRSSDLEFLKEDIGPAPAEQPSNSSFVTAPYFSPDGVAIQYAFRKEANDLISEDIQANNGAEDSVQAVCYWFQRLE